MKPLLIIIFTLTVSFAFAQPRVVSFDSQQGKPDPRKETNILKLNVLEYFVKDYSLYYEKELTNKLSAEVGFGVTFGDFYWNFFKNTISSPSTTMSLENEKLGYSFSAAIRFYPVQALEKAYIAPEFKFREYNWDVTVMDYSNSVNGTLLKVDESRTYIIPRLTFGYVIFLFNNLSLDFNLGFGINLPKETTYNHDTYRLEKVTLKSRPRIHSGFKIGYVF